ncbi:MarR family transcriptional regulator [Streptomyces roseirectus]|uniref:MarR family transcriptional regulator n=1 Tax=Streptomyces roseirectus TaxID=2768066 RepID=A0A7H0IG08_9ACTN|nr:MarR family transcriptional regulator [Streptomyces roseirectus]QNP71724.1 MarR family transcriptional regulator [Streptomyces roseirectus]
MGGQAQFEELARQLSAFGSVKRDLERVLPADCPGGSAMVLGLVGRYGEMRMTHLAELLAVDMSVSSRHVAHLVERGWIERAADPADKRSRILRLTPEGRLKLAELSRRSVAMLAERLGDWDERDVAELVRLLTRMRAEFGECRPGRQRQSEPLPVHPEYDVPRRGLPPPPPLTTTRTPTTTT